MNFNNFLNNITSFEVVFEKSKRKSGLCGIELKDLTYLPYWDLKHTVPDLLTAQDFEGAMAKILSKEKNITFEKIKSCDNYDKAKFLFWIYDQYELIKTLEDNFLKSDPDPKMVRAGVNELNVLEDFNLIDSLAKTYNYTHEQAKWLPYDVIFNIQLKNTITAKIEKKLMQMRKNKGNG